MIYEGSNLVKMNWLSKTLGNNIFPHIAFPRCQQFQKIATNEITCDFFHDQD